MAQQQQAVSRGAAARGIGKFTLRDFGGATWPTALRGGGFDMCSPTPWWIPLQHPHSLVGSFFLFLLSCTASAHVSFGVLQWACSAVFLLV